MSKIRAPKYVSEVIHKRADGYWIDKFYYHKDDKAPGLIVYARDRPIPCPWIGCKSVLTINIGVQVRPGRENRIS